MELLVDILKTLAAVLVALGGVEGGKFLYTRKATRRAANSSAKMEEWNVAEKIQARYSSMLEDKNDKIEKLHTQIGELNGRVLGLTAEKHELQLDNKLLHMQKCEKRSCVDRKPPSDY